MKKFILLLLLFSTAIVFADTKISELPLGIGSATTSSDSFPYVSTATGATKRLTIYDIANVPALTGKFAPIASPTFTGTVTAPTVVGNVTGNVTGNITGAIFSTNTTFPATIGVLRMANNEGIYWRNFAHGANKGLVLDVSDIFQLGSALTVTGNIAATNFSGTTSGTNTGDVTLAAVGSSPNTSGASLSGQALTLQPADGTRPGVCTAIAQTFGGVKTFSSAPVMSALSASQVVATDSGKALASVVYTNANTASAIVQRDSSGNFSAGTISAALTGNASTATALAADPTDCSSNQFATAIAASGNLTCAQPSFSNISSTATSSQVTTATFTAPTVTIKTSSSGTYTVPTSPRTPLYIKIKMIGGGGGGAASGTTNGTVNAAATDTTFSVHSGAAILTAGHGLVGNRGSTALGGVGGTNTLAAGATVLVSMNGNDGNGGYTENLNTDISFSGSAGGAGPWGGAGQAGIATGGNSVANSGAGGPSGGMSAVTNGIVGGGGGAGGYIEAIVTSPSASYDYSVGTGGVGQSLGTSGAAGGNGGSGIIIFEEYYQ